LLLFDQGFDEHKTLVMRKSTPGGLKEFLNIVPFDRQNCIVFAQNLFEAVVVKESQL
jgi:aspartyl-tRNA synthetase